MRRSYVKQFFGTNEAVETAVRVFDKVFRERYNVYGGHREESYKTADGEYTVIMSYAADWMDSPRMIDLFSEYTAKGIEKSFNYRTHNLPDTDEWYFYCNTIKEVPNIEAWRQGKC